MTMKSMKYNECDTIMDGYNPVPPPLPRRVPPVRNIYAEPFSTETNHRYVIIQMALYTIYNILDRVFLSDCVDRITLI